MLLSHSRLISIFTLPLTVPSLLLELLELCQHIRVGASPQKLEFLAPRLLPAPFLLQSTSQPQPSSICPHFLPRLIASADFHEIRRSLESLTRIEVLGSPTMTGYPRFWSSIAQLLLFLPRKRESCTLLMIGYGYSKLLPALHEPQFACSG